MLNDYNENRFVKIGLTAKEARVYLSCLELGPSTVQKIAERTGIKRATVYVAMESLIGSDLISIVPKGKRRLFCASSPENLLTLLKKEKKLLELKEQIVAELITDLSAKLSKKS